MGRRNRRRVAEPLRAPMGGGERREDFDGRTYSVRTISGQAASKAYRCPGCDQQVLPGVAHVVTWPADDVAAEERRHWHSACWNSRHRRAPGVQRSRSAPRY